MAPIRDEHEASELKSQLALSDAPRFASYESSWVVDSPRLASYKLPQTPPRLAS
jgi:hypothetical protein